VHSGGDAHVAYRVVGGDEPGTHDVVLVLSGTMPMDALFDDPIALRFLQGLADLGRLVLFDRCGIGLSDPPAGSNGPTLSQWCDDVAAVVAAADVRRPVLVSNLLGASPTLMYAGRHPGDVGSMILIDPSPLRVDDTLIRGQLAGEVDSVALFCPSRADEPGFREWFANAGQRGASPRRAAYAYPVTTADDLAEIEHGAASTSVPTLVLRRSANRFCPPRATDPMLALVPTAVRVDLPGQDVFAFGGELDALLEELTRFVTGARPSLAHQRAVTAILCSDLVGSTDRASAVGDAHWKRMLDRHDEIVRACVARRGGTLIKTMGDGTLATVPSASNALRAAEDLRAALGDEGLAVRVGVHIGDVDRRGDDISGLAVVIATRLLALAAPGEIVATSTAVQAATGYPHRFESRGDHRLKGVSGEWAVFALAARDD
jgi:class 3 adenylate cyclase/pimeloyl-ACP methyl ester carboxylesterase